MKIKKILWAFLGLVLASPLTASAIEWGISTGPNGTSIGIGSTGSGATSGLGGGGGFSLGNSYGLPEGSILGIIENLLFWLLALFGLFGVIGFVISGIMYLTSAGDSGQIDKAKTAMLYSIMGIIVGLSGFVVLQAVNSWLSGRSTF